MDESYVELLVPCKKSPAAPLIRNALLVLAFFAFVIVALTANVFVFLIVVALLVAAYVQHLHIGVEYEYLYLDKEFTVDKILNQSKRKRIAVYDLDKLEVMAPAGSHHLDAYQGRNDVRTQDFTSHLEDSAPYEMIVKSENTLCRVRVEADDRLLTQMSRKLPRKIYRE